MKKIVMLLVLSMPALVQAQLGPIPQCVDAWNTLNSKGQLSAAETLVKNNCAIMYTKGWLKGTGVKSSVCPTAWNSLVGSEAINHAKELVTRNCQIMYKKGWAACP